MSDFTEFTFSFDSPPLSSIYSDESFKYIVTHVFFPVKLPKDRDLEFPEENYRTIWNDSSLVGAVCAAANAYTPHVCGTSEKDLWLSITKMLDNLRSSVRTGHLDKDIIIPQLRGMEIGDIITFFVRPKNTATIVTKQENSTLFESFEVSPSGDAVKKTPGSLICSYPWFAAEIPNEVFNAEDFQSKLADFLSLPGTIDTHLPFPEYVTALFTGILRGVSRTADITTISKRIRDEVGGLFSIQYTWRRSALWLLIRIAIQMTINHSFVGCTFYKQFILYFLCTLAGEGHSSNLDIDLLHLMSSKILRRLTKLGPSAPHWLSEMALNTCARLGEILDGMCNAPSIRRSPFRNPTEEELVRDTKLSLLNSGEYIRRIISTPDIIPPRLPFNPSHHCRGTLEDFLSLEGAFFDQAYHADPEVTMYDVERSVEQEIDDWIAHVVHADEACAQLDDLMDRYHERSTRKQNPEHDSIKILTLLELFIAIDKLGVQEIPMLADYSTGISMEWLEQLCLRRTTNLHRLSCAYQYLVARESRSHLGWELALSNEFTEDSFPVRYYDQSTDLQQLKAHIEREAMETSAVDTHQLADWGDGASVVDTQDDYWEEPAQQWTPDANPFRSLLCTSPLDAKVVAFELQCPPCFCIWRSAIVRIYSHIQDYLVDDPDLQRWEAPRENNILLADVPEFEKYLVGWGRYAGSHQLRLSYFHPDTPSACPGLCYLIHFEEEQDRDELRSWGRPDDFSIEYGPCLLERYVNSTSHTTNDVLAYQANCPAYISLDKFITFAQLRSGTSLQWFNILCGLRSRTLTLRRGQVHFLLSHAVFQVGSLDPSTGTWIWHQELLDPFFGSTFINELDSLFVDGAGLIDWMFMSNISLLLTRILASSPSARILEQAIALLQRVRRKAFSWVQELSYDVQMAPMNEERKTSLLFMAFACRTTFDVDRTVILPQLIRSAEDVDILLSCSFLIRVLDPKLVKNNYSRLLSLRDSCLSHAIEEAARDVILADPSDRGVDLAIARIFPSYYPGMLRLEALQCPNSRWLTCKANEIRSQPSRMVHIDLLSGQLRVDGQPCGKLPREVSRHGDYRWIFGNNEIFVVPSDLSDMDFMSISITPNYRVHFSLRDRKLSVRAQCNHTKQILELIPKEILNKDLPPVLAYDHVYWLNASSAVVEIRPSGRCWEESAENWRIKCTSDSYHLQKGRESIVDIRSPTYAMLSKCFNCFVGKMSNILATMCSVGSVQSMLRQRITVTLPLHGLSFFVNEMGELESRDFKNMVYDEDQCIQTLFGLESLLVLRSTTRIAGFSIPESLIPRVALVPDGSIDHANSKIVFHENTGTYHTLNVDQELGCLAGDPANLRTQRLLAYLHATTSFHRPDPLTGKTGTRAGLDLLQSAGCRSIAQHRALSHDDSNNSSSWGSTEYPQLDVAYGEIQSRYYWNISRGGDSDWRLVDFRDARRAARLFPPCPQACKDLDYPIPTSESNLDTEPGLLVLLPHRASPASYASSLSYYRHPQVTLGQLLSNRPPPGLPERSTLPRDGFQTSKTFETPALNRLFASLKTNSTFQEEYLTLLGRSASVTNASLPTHSKVTKVNIDELQGHYVKCRTNYMNAVGLLKKTLGPTTDVERALDQFGQWPPVTANILLCCLGSASRIHLSDHWKKCLQLFAQLLLELQRSRRLLRFVLDGLQEEFWKELENEQCDGWSAGEYPDWLLIQIQGDFLIRRNQAFTAMELISPRSGGNTVMQVDMGEGKSSVIIPIVAAALADGKQLVRVIVPKALTGQMFDILVARLGWLANRPIYHLPFSRTAYNDPKNKLDLENLRKLLSQCAAERGILLVQPEHIVSLKLMGIEKQIHAGTTVARLSPDHSYSIHQCIMTRLSIASRLLSNDSLVGGMFRWFNQSQNPSKTRDLYGSASEDASEWSSLLKWIHSNVRDILDESDEVLHPRFQLIYTLGFEQYMDGYPNRWMITQQILQLVKDNIRKLMWNYPDSIEYETGSPGSFPRIYIVRASEVGRRLISMVVEDVMAGRLPNFSFQQIPSAALRDAIRSFISDQDVLQVSDTEKMVEEYAKRSHQSYYLWNGLLLLRGLLSSEILLFAFSERRWRVDYGLLPLQRDEDSSLPTTLAVPFRAKDVPAPNTQFGHPDLVIILTCLSYYYAGLTKYQLQVAFEILLDQDDPSAEYKVWIKDCESLPESLRKLSDINPRSSEEWDNVTFPLFFKNQAVINFYLSRVVFRREAKEFPWKLCGSSWDLGEKRERLVTGFSGTDDGRSLLPLSVVQCDLDHQQEGSASALMRLVRQEREDLDNYIVTHEKGRRQTGLELLRLIALQRPEIRILLDVGAQILDLSNYEVAEAWLDVVRDAKAAVYFNKDDELTVLPRNSRPQPLSSSPFSQQLSKCIVYLDHSHTRGTDLKFPVGWRAAVTLGPKVTKDALVQGCMRMRKLGHGHTVMFFAPPGVDQGIRAVNGKQDQDIAVTISDVLCWAIRETWADIEHYAPYWAQQGIDHQSRYDAVTRFCNNELLPKQLSDAWLQPNCRSLADLYAPRKTEAVESDLSAVPGMQQRCKDLAILSVPRGGLEEELEREVHREREREREVELPPNAEPAKHYLHPDVVSFVKSGVIPPPHSGSAFVPVFMTLEQSTAATRDADVWSPSILATADFSRTIKPESTKGTMDQYLRPVQWILSGKTNQGPVLVILSPFEANLLMPDIRVSKHVYLHLYAPRTAERMKPSDDLRLYAIPPLPSDWTPPWELIDQLNVFAGQLYLRDYESYLRLCRFLEVPTHESQDDDKRKVLRNLFKIPGSFEEMEVTFRDSPLPAVMALLAIRNRGRPFDHTHMGKILQGRVLTKEDVEKPKSATSTADCGL